MLYRIIRDNLTLSHTVCRCFDHQSNRTPSAYWRRCRTVHQNAQRSEPHTIHCFCPWLSAYSVLHRTGNRFHTRGMQHFQTSTQAEHRMTIEKTQMTLSTSEPRLNTVTGTALGSPWFNQTGRYGGSFASRCGGSSPFRHFPRGHRQPTGPPGEATSCVLQATFRDKGLFVDAGALLLRCCPHLPCFAWETYSRPPLYRSNLIVAVECCSEKAGWYVQGA